MQTTSHAPKQSDSSLGKSIVSGIVSWVIIPLAIIITLNTFVFQTYHVVGNSMYPTLHDSDYLIASKVDHTKATLGKLFGGTGHYIPKRGEIAIFHYPKQPDLVYVKRVVGLPGERVVVGDDGSVKVFNKENPNGLNPDEGYELAGTFTNIPTDVVVPDGTIFVLGDNRQPNGSSDSRDWGVLPSDDIIGVASVRLLPLKDMKFF